MRDVDPSSGQVREGDLVVQSSELALMNIASLAQTGALDLSPKFQRRNRWNRERRSKLVESFIINAPVPPVYLAEEKQGRLTVIDGKQRLTAIAGYLNGEFELERLTFLPELNGLPFAFLSQETQRTLLMRPLRAVTIMRQTAEWMKHEVFMRLNTGGQPLNAQELRNVAYAGRFNELLLSLSEHPFLRHQLKIKNEHSPAYADMSDVEYVLRFFAIAATWKNFAGDLRLSLNDFMNEWQYPSAQHLSEFEFRFLRAMDACAEIWGDYAFRRFDGSQWRNVFLGAMYDAQMVAVDRLSKPQLARVLDRRELVLDRTIQLFFDPEFEASVRLSTNTASRVRYRVERVHDLLVSVAGA